MCATFGGTHLLNKESLHTTISSFRSRIHSNDGVFPAVYNIIAKLRAVHESTFCQCIKGGIATVHAQ